MNETKLSVRAIAKKCNVSIPKLALLAGIDPTHLHNVAYGNARMTADDLLKLSRYSGVSPFDIQTE